MKRIRYFDLLRCISFIFIIFYHMMVQLQLSEIYTPEKVAPFFTNDNMHIATLGVAVFFILSGASLMYTTKDNFNIKDFYKKRFFKILVPYYITVVLYFIFIAIMNKGIHGIFTPGIAKWRVIFSFMGIDTWLSMYGIPTFSLGIGEWFLGCIIILYLLFPLFRYLMINSKKAFFICATCLYLIIIYNYHSDVAMHVNILVKGYEFVLGMFLGYTCLEFKEKWSYVTIPVVVFFFTSSTAVGINYALKITLLAVAFWISISYLENFLNKKKFRLMNIISNYSYEVFLVHHVIIYTITAKAKPYLRGPWSVILMFIIQLICMVVGAVVLKYISTKLTKPFLTKKGDVSK